MPYSTVETTALGRGTNVGHREIDRKEILTDSAAAVDTVESDVVTEQVVNGISHSSSLVTEVASTIE